MLRIGSRDKLRIRKEHLDFGSNLRLLYISDLHLTRWTPHIVQQLQDVCGSTLPNLILLGGDLVDLPNGLPLLSQFIQSCPYPVWAIGGNHDRLVGLSAIRHNVVHSGGYWLETCEQVHPGVFISGKLEASPPQHTILCAHDPAIFPQAAEAGYHLILAGHLHGGQMILTQRHGKFYPGAFLSQWTGDKFKIGHSIMLVSKGVHDTLPIRWNCPREVILCCC